VIRNSGVVISALRIAGLGFLLFHEVYVEGASMIVSGVSAIAVAVFGRDIERFDPQV